MRDMKNRNFGDWAIALTVVACSVVLFLALALALSGTMLGKPGRALRVNFHDVMGITPGAQVKYGGAMAGKVAGIRMLTLQERTATGDPLNNVEVTLALNDNVPPLPPAPFPPQPDTSSNGRLSTASFRMPYPKGHTKNPFGLVQSPGELGFIHTGLEGKSKGTPAKVGIPWRTLRLQPSRKTDHHRRTTPALHGRALPEHQQQGQFPQRLFPQHQPVAQSKLMSFERFKRTPHRYARNTEPKKPPDRT